MICGSVWATVDKVYLIDNNSSNIKDVKSKFKSKKIEIISNKNNFGIAYALNQALAISQKDSIDYLITLDQDSIFKTKEVNKVLKHLDEPDVAIFCPVIKDINKNGKRTTCIYENIGNLDKLKQSLIIFSVSVILMIIACFVEVYLTVPIAKFILG